VLHNVSAHLCAWRRARRGGSRRGREHGREKGAGTKARGRALRRSWAQGQATDAGCPMAVAKMPSRRVTMAVAASLALVGSGEAFLQAPVIKGASHLERQRDKEEARDQDRE